MHLAYRWFTGLGLDREVPHHSTFSKNRHGRFQESPLFLELFERIVQQCMNIGLLKGAGLSVDNTQIRADASPDRAITREQLPETAKVNRTVREYVEQVECENVVAGPPQPSDPFSSEAEGKLELRRTYPNLPPMKISATDREADLSSKRGASESAYWGVTVSKTATTTISSITKAASSPAYCRLQRASARRSLLPGKC